MNNDIDSNIENTKKFTNTFFILPAAFIIIATVVGFIIIDTLLSNKSKTTDDNTETTTTTSGEQIKLDVLRKEKEAFILGEIIDNIEYDKEYLNDYNFKFVYFVYHADNYINVDETNINGEVETGRRRFNINMFNSFYQRLMGEQFDISKLDKDSFYKASEFPTLEGDYLYTSVYSGYAERPVVYVNTILISDGTYVDTYNYCELDGVNPNKDKVLGKVYVKYSIDPKGFTSYKSIVINK